MTDTLTGIEIVDLFLRDLPKIYEPDHFSRAPVCFGFRSDNGIDIVEVKGEQPNTDNFMDAAANAFIAYAKTVRPVAVVLVSETFVTTCDAGQGPPPRVDCDRFNRDGAYRAQILTERQERLIASVETARGAMLLQWPVVRDRDGYPRLGERLDNAQRLRGRLMNLLAKASAADEMVETAGARRYPVSPRSLAENRRRLAAALVELPKAPEEDFDLGPHLIDFPTIGLIVGLYDRDVTIVATNLGPRVPRSEFRARVVSLAEELFDRNIPPDRIVDEIASLTIVGAIGLRIEGLPEAWI